MSLILRLVRSELRAGIGGLKLFIACVAMGTMLLGAVWILAGTLDGAFERNGRQILGGDVEIAVAMQPLEPGRVEALGDYGTVSRVVDLRSLVRSGSAAAPVELRAVDGVYPLYGTLAVDGAGLPDALVPQGDRFGALADPTLLSRLGVEVGDTVTLGSTEVELRGTIAAEPDRLSAGAFMVGPRLIVSDAALREAGLLAPGALVDYRYRIRLAEGVTADAFGRAAGALEPPTGWELRTPQDAAERVRRIVDRTTSFLGIAGVMAVAIALAGTWAASSAWVGKRSRTIALYRLSGADVSTVAGLHGLIVAVAATIGIGIGLAVATGLAMAVVRALSFMLPMAGWWADLGPAVLQTAAIMLVGIVGSSLPAITSAASISPGSAMRSGDGLPRALPGHVATGAALVAGAVVAAVATLPASEVALRAALWLAGTVVALAAGGYLLSLGLRRLRVRGFVAGAALRALGEPRSAAAKALAIGIGIVGVSSLELVRSSLDEALRAELPDRTPEIVLVDVQTGQLGPLEDLAADLPGIAGIEVQPNLRAVIREVNGRPAREAVVDRSEAWVVEGDRSLSWSAGPVESELLAGSWWPEDHAGPPLLSIEEDVAEAFDIGPGDRITYSVLGRLITAEVANVRDEDRRSLSTRFLLISSPDALRAAPQTWIGTVDGEDAAVDRFLARLNEVAPNVTAVDIRRILRQVAAAIDGAAFGALAIAGALLLTGGLTLAAVMAAETDARAREALTFALVGASRTEIALARLSETAMIGLIATLVGGGLGIFGAWWLTTQALRIDWHPSTLGYLLPPLLGLLAATAAGTSAGIGGMPRGRGEIARRLAG